MKISEIIEFKAPKKVYDKPGDYVDARTPDLTFQMFGHHTKIKEKT